jgi:hypothetical protein
MNCHFAHAGLRASTGAGRVWAGARRIRWSPVIAWLLLAALIPVPRMRAASATVQLSGTWTTVNDTALVLDGSIATGSNFVATLVYDDTTTNANTGSIAAFAGTYLVAPDRSDFSITSGHYSFTLPGTELVEIDVDHLYSSFPDEIILYAEGYVLNGPLPGGVSGGFGYANPQLQNYAKNALTDNSLTGVPWSLSSWPSTDFYLFIGINGAGSGQYVELDGTIDRIVPRTLPQFTGMAVSGADLILSGSNILAGSYVLVVSTNVSAAPAQWTAIMTNAFAGETGFTVTATNEFSANVATRFYRYRTP